MDLRPALQQLPQLGYSHRGLKTQPAQAAHYALRRSGISGTPIGLELRVSGQGPSLPVVPWITFLDPDVTTKVTVGIYVVYLFSSDLQRVFLTLNQGATQHLSIHQDSGLKGKAAERASLAEIAHETSAIKGGLLAADFDVDSDPIDLGSGLFLPMAYEAGAITCRSYALEDLPSNDALLADLEHTARAYPAAVSLKDELVAANPTEFRTSSRQLKGDGPKLDVFFRPKDSSEYVAEIGAHVQRKSRKHEALLEQFAVDIGSFGWTANSNVHPRDLEVTRHGETWLVEAKTVGPNAEHAVREAIGQLYSYRHFHYRRKGSADPKMLALFNEPIGKAFVELLEELGIDACWRDGQRWIATPKARHMMLR